MIFIIGICIGSFTQCLIDRYPHYLLSVRSRCPACRHALSVFDLFPVLSFLLLKGKCRYCKAEIPISNLIAEVLFGSLYLILFTLPVSLKTRFLIAAILPFLYLAAAVDIKQGEIPDLCSIVLTCLAVLFASENLSSACIAAMLCLFCVRFGWLGAGDAKLITAFALLKGIETVFALWIASLTCILFSLFSKKKERHIPFAPFLCIGFLLCLLLF